MEILENLVIAVHVMAALSIIGLVLLQQGKGAEAGTGFGSGASATIFGSSGSGNFLSRTTTILLAVFFATSFGLAYFASQKTGLVVQTGIPQVETAKTPPAEQPAASKPAVETDKASKGDSSLPDL